MGQPIFSGMQLPEYHEGMLIVKVRSSSSLRSALTATAARSNVLDSHGISALSTFERAGLIKRITPITPSRQEQSLSPSGRGVITTLAASLEGTSPNDINSGVNIVELERDEDIPELQIALANDPNIEYVSRVAVRYLVSQTKSSRAGVGIAAVPPPVSSMWNLAKIRWQEAIDLPEFKNAASIRVAVLDTGIDTTHPDLQGKVSS